MNYQTEIDRYRRMYESTPCGFGVTRRLIANKINLLMQEKQLAEGGTLERFIEDFSYAHSQQGSQLTDKKINPVVNFVEIQQVADIQSPNKSEYIAFGENPELGSNSLDKQAQTGSDIHLHFPKPIFQVWKLNELKERRDKSMM